MKTWKLFAGLSAVVAVAGAAARGEIVERVIARVNGDIVTLSEFEARQLSAVQAARIPADQVETFLRQSNVRILQDAVDDLLIVQRGLELGVRLRPEYIQEVIDGIKKDNNIADDAELRKALRREGMTLEDLRRNIERSVIRRQVLARELEGKTTATEADARTYYESHKDEFTKPAFVHLQEIVVADEAQARDLAARAKGGEDFAELARAHSTSGSRAAGGDLGQVSRADMAPELQKVVSALPKGGVSEPLAIAGGLRVVRVVEKSEAQTAPFAEVKDELVKRVGQERMAKVYEEYIEGLRKASVGGIKTMVSEVPLQVNLPPPGTPSVTSPGGLGAPSAPLVPVVPGIDASEIGTSGADRPERVAPPPPPSPVPSPAAPGPSPSPAG